MSVCYTLPLTPLPRSLQYLFTLWSTYYLPFCDPSSIKHIRVISCKDGRLRVLLKREDGTLYNPAIHNKKQLMLHVAELVPRLPGRTKKQEATSSSTTVSSKSGKGKKKR